MSPVMDTVKGHNHYVIYLRSVETVKRSTGILHNGPATYTKVYKHGYQNHNAGKASEADENI